MKCTNRVTSGEPSISFILLFPRVQVISISLKVFRDFQLYRIIRHQRKTQILSTNFPNQIFSVVVVVVVFIESKKNLSAKE